MTTKSYTIPCPVCNGHKTYDADTHSVISPCKCPGQESLSKVVLHINNDGSIVIKHTTKNTHVSITPNEGYKEVVISQ